MILSMKKALNVLEWHLQQRGYKEGTIRGHLIRLAHFKEYCRQQKIEDLRDLREATIYDFYTYLRNLISDRTGNPLGGSSIQMTHAGIKLLFNTLYQEGLVLTNPARDVVIKTKKPLDEKAIFTVSEMTTYLDAIDIYAPLGLRDRALFELIYSSALRVGEASHLDVSDLDFQERILLVRQSKFSKDRMVPISKTAESFLKLYISERKNKKTPLFMSERYSRLGSAGIQKRFRKHLEASGLEKGELTVHSIRHSCATHLLAAGADIRYVQELLGHESAETTVLYTHMLDEGLKRSYRSHHPRENELYLEVDEAYLRRIDTFKAQLLGRKRKKIDGQGSSAVK